MSPTHPPYPSPPEEKKRGVVLGMKMSLGIVISSGDFSFYQEEAEHSVLLPIKHFLQQLEEVSVKRPRNTYTKWLEWLPPPSWDFNLWTRILITLINITKLIWKDKTKSVNLLQIRMYLQLMAIKEKSPLGGIALPSISADLLSHRIRGIRNSIQFSRQYTVIHKGTLKITLS